MAEWWESAPLADQQAAGEDWWSTAPLADQTQAPAPTWGDTAMDMGASLVSGIGRGAAGVVGIPGTIGDAFNSGMSWLTGLPELPKSPVSAAGLQRGLSIATGGASDYEPQTTAGEYAGTVGEFLPGAAIGGLGAGNMLRFGVLPGVASEAAGQATEGTAMEPYARVAAALATPMAPAILQKAVSPFSGAITPERMRAVEALRAEGVNPTAGQITGSQRLRATEQELGGFRERALIDAQQEAFTSAAMRRAGGSGLATPENMSKTLKAIGDKMDDLATRTKVQFDNQLQTDLLDDAVNYTQMTGSGNVAPVVEDIVSRINNVATKNNGVITGEMYKKFRTELGTKAQSTRDPAITTALRDIQESLDEAVARSMPSDVLPQWQQARKEYRNFITLERAATTGGGEAAASGVLSPARLRGATVATQGRRNYATGRGDFDELARSGEQVLTSPPNSGTALRLDARTLGGLTTGGGAGAGALMSGPTGAVAGALLGAAAPAIAGRGLMWGPTQRYLTNQAIPQMSTMDPRMLAVIQGLMANEEAR